MAIDTSIYQNIKPVQINDPLDAMGKAANLSQMQMQSARGMNQMAKEEQEAKAAEKSRINKEIIPDFQYLEGLSPDKLSNEYPAFMQRAATKGMSTENLIKDQQGNIVFDPQVWQTQVNGMKSSPEYREIEEYQAKLGSLKNKDQLDNKKFAVDERLANSTIAKNNQEIASKRAELTVGGKLTEGQKVVDKEFAKDYNDWTSGGAKNARSEINKLGNVISSLKEDKVSTGGLTGMFGDRVTSDEVLSARADVQSTVMNSLKAILGAQFTEKEGDRIIKNTWNESDSTQNNTARLEKLVGDLNNQASDKDLKARHYERNGSLASFKQGEAPTEDVPLTMTRDGKTKAIPSSMKGKAIADGWSMVK